jgi:dipeptidyl aminopeptidase/acylaminoacyl peptidase
VRLTEDGEEDWDYATPLASPVLMMEQRTSRPTQPAAVFWSPDSKHLLTDRLDSRRAGRLTMVQHAPPDRARPRAYTYVYPQAGDSVLPTAAPILFEVGSWRRTPVHMPALGLQYYGGPGFRWTEDGSRATVVVPDRGYTRVEVREIDPATGDVRVLLEEEGEPLVDTSMGYLLERLDGGRRLLWGSERDGWMHLYLIDSRTGDVVRQLTRGPWVVRDIERVDEDAGVVYFTASGREPGRDPYLRHLYRVGLDGRGLRLLTPEPADHQVELSPSGRYFVDTYSRPDLAPVSVLRRASDGRVVRELERADVGALLATGWKWPEPFRAKARDGRTDVYGLLWLPSTFDPGRRYPVVEQIYTGPQGYFVPKSFMQALRNSTQSIAELGFAVVMVDGLGTAGRGREFHSYSFRNLADAGLEDHIAALRQLAGSHPYLDLSRVGVYGHSAGGHDAARAILAHPEFYRVAVASAGSHDSRVDKAWWNTQWMGWPVGEAYADQANSTLAANLRGKLLLAHGDTDENVPVSTTLQLADALIRANQDFDLLIVPNTTHGGLAGSPYFTRRRWDYFVRNLLGVTPPEEYEIGAERAR